MGTRGSVGIITKEGKYKSSYNHFDSYPTGLGQDMVKVINKINNNFGWDKFSNIMSNIELVDERAEPTETDYEFYKKYYNENVGTGDGWYSLLRDLQGSQIFEEILSGKDIKHMISGNDFIESSLHCEYAYIINLSDNTFEVYEGYQTTPQKGNRFGEIPDNGYYPCALISKVPFDKVTKDWMYDLDEKLSNEYKFPNIWLKEIRKEKIDTILK